MNKVVAFAIASLLLSSALFAGVISRDQALGLAFPGAQIQTNMLFLTQDEMKNAARISGTEVSSALVAQYQALSSGKLIGRAYLDTHIVRTKRESLLVILNPDASVRRIEVVAFDEPPEYLPSAKWYDQFTGKKLDSSVSLKGAIHPVTGASLTARAVVDAVRRVLAIDQVISTRSQTEPAGP
jgi:Na+-translocating ferredoxin:NAD+ oxidoreductase RnfG subunit